MVVGVVGVIKKLFAAGIILLLVCMNIPSTGRVMEQTSTLSTDGITRYVGGSGPGNYTKIQDAIDNSSDGDTVFVYKGEYHENLRIEKSINLIGENKNLTIVEADEYYSSLINIYADEVKVSGFTIQGSFFLGVYTNENSCIISDNIIKNNGRGIDIGSAKSKNNTVHNNILIDNFMQMRGGSYHTISNNSFINTGIEFFDVPSNIVCSNNTVNGKPLIYLENKKDMIFNEEAGQIILVSCENVTVENQNIWYTEDGIQVLNSNNCLIADSIISGNANGIIIRDYSERITIFGNTIYDNENTGIQIRDTGHNYIINNDIYDQKAGIQLKESSNNNIAENYIHNNFDGIRLGDESNNNYIEKNSIINNGYGIYNGWKDDPYDIVSTTNTTIELNHFEKNVLYLSFASRNKIFRNNFISCIADYQMSFFNKWDGNYWGKSRILPKLIFGINILPWIQIDWHPAQEPYDI